MPTTEPRKPLQALLIADDRPGHYTLAEGILAAIGRKRPVAVTRLEVKRPFWMPARALSFATNAGMAPYKILQQVYHVDPDLPDCDLVVSAGGNTLAANIAAAKLTKAPNIFYGSLRRYRPEDFSLVMTSYPGRAQMPRHLMTLKPSAMNPDEMPLLGSGEQRGAGVPPLLGLIIGGDSGTITYDAADWDLLFEFMDDINRASGTRFIVANAPRTPDTVSDCIKGLAARGHGPVEYFLDFRETGPGTLPQLLADIGAVLVTADSSTMLSECIWARRKAVALAPLNFALPDEEMSYRNWLSENGWYRQLKISELSQNKLERTIRAISPLKTNPLDALAESIADRLPELF